jgi:chromate reductase, NAD(P)H dehydrogenase (quinone)
MTHMTRHFYQPRSIAADGAALESLTFLAFLPYQVLGSDMPTKVKEFKSKIRGADVILSATPEYNLSVPEALNNAIDWASRPYGDASNGKLSTMAQIILDS